MRRQQSDVRTDGTAPPSESQPAIAAENVEVTYEDGTKAVCGIDLAVSAGEFFGFLGPNGAGKTTTIRTLVTLLYPTQGTVRINGHDTKREPQAVRESIGYMAQETSIDLELTPRENLQVACEVYGVPGDERAERIENLLDLVDLQDVADKRAETFSGGMQKRLDTATVLVHRPPVVFLDEPTTGLDPEARLRVWNYFEEINERGTTVFLTTQYLEEADHLCDRLAVLDDGQIIAEGTPNSLKAAVGDETVTVTLTQPTDRNRKRALDAIRAADALDESAVETTADGIAVHADNAQTVTPEVVAALDEAGIPVRGLDVESPTLDDVFFALTSDQDADRETKTAPAAREVVQ
jgi:ABC-2 type transport system ATP-binding protein